MTEKEIKNFFDEVYSKCQDSFAVSDDWDYSTAEEKRFYDDMYNYAFEKVKLKMGQF